MLSSSSISTTTFYSFYHFVLYHLALKNTETKSPISCPSHLVPPLPKVFLFHSIPSFHHSNYSKVIGYPACPLQFVLIHSSYPFNSAPLHFVGTHVFTAPFTLSFLHIHAISKLFSSASVSFPWRCAYLLLNSLTLLVREVHSHHRYESFNWVLSIREF